MSENELPDMQRRLLAFARIFLADQDQFPTLHASADRFQITPQAIHAHYLALADKGFIERNRLGKWRFTRERNSDFASLT